MRRLSGDDDLDDVGILLRHPFVDSFQVLRKVGQIVVRDDALHVLESANGVCDVRFEIDPFKPTRHDALLQKHLAGFLRPAPAPSVLWPADRRDHRAWLVRKQALEIERSGDKVDTQFDECGAALAGFPDFGDHHLVAGPPNYHADPLCVRRHRCRPVAERCPMTFHFMTGFPPEQANPMFRLPVLSPWRPE